MPDLGYTQYLTENNGLARGTIPSMGATWSNTQVIQDVNSNDEVGNSVYHRTTVIVNGTMTLTDNGSVNGGAGGVPIYTFPLGAIQVGGGAGSLTLTAAGTNATNVSTTGVPVVALGTTQAGTGSTLTGVLANSIASTSFTLAARTKSQSIVNTSATPTILDGTTTSKSMFLNLAIPASNSTGATNFAVVGFCTFIWTNTGTIS